MRKSRLVRGVAAAIGIVTAATLAGACGGERSGGDDGSGPYRGGRLTIATGNTTGVYYQLGGGLAELISKDLPGYQVTAEATGASVENIQRVTRGDADIAFTLADAAADAVAATGPFSGQPQPIRALARIYPNHTHVIARADAGVRRVADLRGKRVSTGSPNSGTEAIALRLLNAAGLDPKKDVHGQSLSLTETVQAVKDGTIDALFWSGGLPTAGITDLTTSMKGKVTFVPLDDLVEPMRRRYGDVYQPVALGKDAYHTPADVPSIAVPNLLIVSDRLPEGLAHDLAKLIFDRQADLAAVHPEGRNIRREMADKTTPVPLHPGAGRFYAEA